MKSNKRFPLSKVTLKNTFLINAFEKEILYLTSLDIDRLLAGFRETAGLDMKGVERYPSWESMLIGGHTLGHYMSACARACESDNCNDDVRNELMQIIKGIVDGLFECQMAGGTGYLFGAQILDKNNVELQFDYVEQNKSDLYTQAWVPWYTLHKLFEGLVSVINMDVDKNKADKIKNTAKQVTSKLADWVYDRVNGWDEETHATVLGIEYGGMNDCLYDVYVITGKNEHLEAAHAFDQVDLFEKILNAKVGDNILNNHHANTTIPKFLGALKRYIVTGDVKFLEYATHFWTMVTENHTYITGGNSEWEHFGEDKILNSERTNCNCETCNVYNMLKMTMHLFMITGDVKYADWYENAYINTILSSQNPQTGMTTYFQPMASGYYKVYGERYDKFWCCIGTGMENFTKLQESFYFMKDNSLIVNQYISSSVKFMGTVITQSADIPQSDKVVFTIEDKFEGNILLRLPYWLASSARITVNDKKYDYNVIGGDKNKGYALVEGPFEANTKIEIILPMKIMAYNLPDSENTYAFKYGPVVLSALLGDKDMIDDVTGVNVTIPGECIIEKKYIPSEKDLVYIKEGTVKDFISNIENNMLRQGDDLRFVLNGTDSNLIYVPHYSQYKERYGIYFNFCSKGNGEE